MPKSTQTAADVPNLLERTFAAGCHRVAIVSLHQGAGARTAIESIANEFSRRGVPTGVTRAPRLPLDTEDIASALTRVSLPEGTVVVTSDALAGDGGDLELIEPLGHRSMLGDLGLYRLVRGGAVTIYGPDEPESMAYALAQLQRVSGGLALADGAWERRAFAAPDIADGVILVLGSGFSISPERSVAALSYIVEILQAGPCDRPFERAWPVAQNMGQPLALDAHGSELARFPRDCVDPAPILAPTAQRLSAILLPDGLHDGLLAPLTRSPFRCSLVVKDATRIHVAPIYYRAWRRGGGTVRVVQPMRVLSVATNPYNPNGPDIGADRFRDLVLEALPDMPVHDVRLESHGPARRPLWKFWA